MILDVLGRIVWANSAAQELFSSSRIETSILTHKPFYTFFTGESRGLAHKHFASLRAGTAPSFPHTGPHVTVGLKPFQNSIFQTTFGVLNRQIGRFFLVFRPESKEEAKRVPDRVSCVPEAPTPSKEALGLLAQVTHEMRTPLVSVVGFSEMLLQERIHKPEHVKEYIGYIYQASQHVLALVNEILELQNFQKMGERGPFICVNLAQLMRECIALMAPQSYENHIALCMEGPETLEIHGHGRRLRQIFLNLLSNSIKFTNPGGKITLSCTRMTKDSVRIQCCDTGIGMSGEQMRAILHGQVESTWRERKGGMGLGLLITQQLVAQHHGLFSIKSEKNEGTCIEIILPLEQESRPLAAAEEVLLPG
jgi:signal transduction histidine kinase